MTNVKIEIFSKTQGTISVEFKPKEKVVSRLLDFIFENSEFFDTEKSI